MLRGLVVVVLLIGFAILVVMVATDPGDNVSLVSTGLRTDSSGIPVVTGTLQNNTDRSYDEVEVEVALLDNDGVRLGRTVASRANLRGGEIWSFAAPVARNNAVRFRVVGLVCRRTGESKNLCSLGSPVEVR